MALPIPIDIIRYLASFLSLPLAIRLGLTSKETLPGTVHCHLRQISVSISRPTQPMEIFEAAAAFKGDFSLADSLYWSQENGVWTPYPSIGPTEYKGFFDKFAKRLRRIHFSVPLNIEPGTQGGPGFMPHVMQTFDPERLEEFSLRCRGLESWARAFLITAMPRLKVLILTVVIKVELLFPRIVKHCSSLEHIELAVATAELYTESNVIAISTIVEKNKNLNYFSLDRQGHDLTSGLDQFVNLVGFSEAETPTLLGLESACLQRFGCSLKIFRIANRTAWHSLYCDEIRVGMRDGNLDVADADFDYFYASTSSIIDQIHILMEFYAILCEKKSIRQELYLGWVEKRIISLMSHPGAEKDLSSALVLPLMFLLGSNMMSVPQREEKAVRKLRKKCRSRLAGVPDAVEWLFRQTFTPMLYLPTVTPIFPAVLSCIDWCVDGSVNFSEDQLGKLRSIIRSYPMHVESFIKDRHYDPLARLPTGETMAGLLVREVSAHGKSALVVTWAELALASCVQSGVKLRWQEINMDYDVWCCLVESQPALQSIAIVFDTFDAIFSEEKYLEFRTNASYIPRIKTLLEAHAVAWPDDPPISSTLEKLSSQLWKEVLWTFSAESDAFAPQLSAMRSSVHALLSSFPKYLPRFMKLFMKGKQDNLVQSNPVAVRECLHDLLSPTENCISM